jgi:hypothetical protein
LSKGFMARVFESRHRYFHLNIGLLRKIGTSTQPHSVFLILIFLILIFLILIFLILIFSTPWILLFQRSGSLPFGISMLRISILDGSLGGPALSGGRRFRQRLPVAGTISASTMHLSGAWTDEASANSCNPCDRVSRGHSVGFTQFAVTADRTPRIFANAMSSCGFGYPLLASLERRDL